MFLKNASIVLLSLLFMISCKKEVIVKTQPNPALQQNWKTLNVLGKPESIIETNYKQHVPDSLLDDVITRESFYFDESGNLIKRQTYGEQQLLQHTREYEYDDMGNIMKIITTNGRGSTTNVQENILDSVGNAKQVKNFDHDGKLVFQMSYKYDTHRNPVEWKQEEPPIAVIYKRKYVYDEKDRCIEKEDITGGKHQVKEVIRYDTANVTVTHRYVDGTLDLVTTEKFSDTKQLLSQHIQYTDHLQEKSYQYDKAGNVIEMIYRWDGEVDSIYSYRASYTFDDQGNWTKRIKRGLDNKPKTEVERKIGY
jgi:hypothetical protein